MTGRSLRARMPGAQALAVAGPDAGIHCRRALGRSAMPAARHPAIQGAWALPRPAAETYTAHSSAVRAVQSNEVYLTPCTAVPSISIRLGVR